MKKLLALLLTLCLVIGMVPPGSQRRGDCLTGRKRCCVYYKGWGNNLL